MSQTLYLICEKGRWYRSTRIVKTTRKAPKLKGGQKSVRLEIEFADGFMDPQKVKLTINTPVETPKVEQQ